MPYKRNRILAVDYGEKNIGLACSDDMGLIARPLPSIPNRGQGDLITKIEALVKEMDIQQVVVGIPLNMDGTRGQAVVRIERLIAALEKSLGKRPAGVDERLSTTEAMELWDNMSPRRRKKYRTVDSLAAALILERYLREG